MSKRHGNKEVKKPKKLGAAAGPAAGPVLPAGKAAPAATPPVAARNKR